MKGLELSKQFFLTFGQPVLQKEFPAFEHFAAIGLVGSGSECFGYDDSISQDHDFEPGFCVFLPDESVVDRKTAFGLERAYAALPKEFMGFKRLNISPVGGNRHGVMRTSDFYRTKAGTADGKLTLYDWFSIPEFALAEATNGQVFLDNYGEFSRIRKALSAMPEDVRLKKMAGHLLLMEQSGQYNYARCLARGETGASQLAIAEFVKSAMQILFLFNNVYMPYYKWAFRALRELPQLGELADSLEFLLSSDNSPSTAVVKKQIIQDLANIYADTLRKQGLSDEKSDDLEKHAFSVNAHVGDNDLRNKHILFGI